MKDFIHVAIGGGGRPPPDCCRSDERSGKAAYQSHQLCLACVFSYCPWCSSVSWRSSARVATSLLRLHSRPGSRDLLE